MSGWVPALLHREWRGSLQVGTVTAGDSPHSLFVNANGALLVCGFEHGPGTLGLPRDQDEDHQFRTVLVPRPVPSMAGTRIRQVVAYCHCSLAVSEEGHVYMWGEGESNTEDRLVPTLIQELSHHRVRQVDIHSHVCAAVTEEGLLFTWATAASEGLSDVDTSTELKQPLLGLGLESTTTAGFWPPQRVTALIGERVFSVAIGYDFTLVTTEAGAVFSFGDNTRGSLGHGDTVNRILPKRIEALDGVYVAAIAVGMCQSLALTACGRFFWWGSRINSRSEFELQRLPQPDDSAFGGGRVRSIAANFHAAYAVTDTGALFTWGCDGYAHDGIFPLTHGHCQVQLSPWPVAGLNGVTVAGVSAGGRHTLALAADGSVYEFSLGRALGIGWGVGGEGNLEDLEGDPADEAEGQMILGGGGARIRLTPKKVPGLICSVPRGR
jgi:alpha-tubulin suppressor-like RCC1 family protein